MQYENRPVPEGINVSRDHPLKEFFALLLALVLILVLAVGALALLAGQLVRFIPFQAEARLMESVAEQQLTTELTPAARETRSYLRELGAGLAAEMGVPAEMPITIHYQPEPVVNAFATLGGHVVIYRGLLEQMPHENALAMVLAHEIAHIHHRDPIAALGRGLTVSVFLATVSGLSQSGAVASLLHNVGLVSQMRFSREQERAADRAALAALQGYYGHTAGAEELFEILRGERREPPPLFSTHPLSEERLEAVHRFQATRAAEGEPTPLPASVRGTLE